MDFLNKMAKKWEQTTGLKHKAKIEINPDKFIEYYDHGFIKQIALYAEELHHQNRDQFEALRGIRKELRGY